MRPGRGRGRGPDPGGPGGAAAAHRAWPGTDFSYLKPSIGYYDDAQTATLHKQITQAAGAALDYFAFYWYWNGNPDQEIYETALDIFLVYAWNEWEEGGTIEPDAEFGCKYLDILQQLSLPGAGCVAGPSG